MRYTNPIYSNRLNKKVKQINKTQARKIYEAGETVYLLPCLCNLDGMWMSPYPVSKDRERWNDESFDMTVFWFTSYNCNSEFGNYPIFFKEV